MAIQFCIGLLEFGECSLKNLSLIFLSNIFEKDKEMFKMFAKIFGCIFCPMECLRHLQQEYSQTETGLKKDSGVELEQDRDRAMQWR